MSGKVVGALYHGGHWFDLSGAFGASMAAEGDATELEHHDEVPEAHLHGTARDLRRGVREWFHGFSPAGAAVLAAAVVMSVAAADVYAGPGVDLTLLYLGPSASGPSSPAWVLAPAWRSWRPPARSSLLASPASRSHPP